MIKLDAIVAFLGTIEPGQVSQDKLRDLAALLGHVWDDFAGSSEAAMKGSKLTTRNGSSRIENVRWQPPNLTFNIERHGGVVLGSKRAEYQEWTANLAAKCAVLVSSRERLIRPAEKPLDVKRLAEELSAKVLSREEDPRISRQVDGTVKLLIGKIIKADSIAKATLTGRRKRFHDAIKKSLQSAGWSETSRYIFKPIEPKR